MHNTADIEQIFRTHYDAIYRLATGLMKDEETGRDVVSDVFADLLHDRITVLPEACAADARRTRAFLLLCVRTRCLNLLNRRQTAWRIRRLLTLETSPTVVIEAREPDRWDAIAAFIETRLSPQTRRTLQLRFEQHLKYREISDRMGISEVAVYKHLAQGIRQIKQHFNP